MAEKKGSVESRISPMNFIGVAILLVCYMGAIWNVFQVKKDELFLGKKVIRLCHWQLEMGVRSAIGEMGKMYEAKHPDRSVVQIPLTERVYGQWVTTQLIGRTAPDIIEIGFFNINEYLSRYFIPLTEELRKPNPYNADNKFKDTPWMDTFIDGLQNSYKPDLVDYFSVGFSQFNVRMFCNNYLYKKLLGRTDHPKTLEDFFACCEKISEYAKLRNDQVQAYNKAHPPKWWNSIPFMPKTEKKPYVLFPVCSSRYQVNLFKYRYAGMLTADKYLNADLALYGYPAPSDILYGLLKGELSVDDPQYKAANEIVRDIAKHFPPGFMSIDRMDAGFSFVQGRSVMITSGSWDASSFIKQINDQPFGDVVLSVNGAPVSNSAEAAKALLAASGEVKVKFDREGFKFERSLLPLPGSTLWERYGIELDDFSPGQGKPLCATVVDVESASVADNAGISPRKRFEVGIFDFPPPSKDNPAYGKYYVGKVAETSDTGFNFGIVKFTKNLEEAIDFLQFCTTPANNQRLNEVAQWIPAVKGAKPTEFLQAFVPHYEGYWGSLDFEGVGVRSKTKVSQAYWPYISQEIDYDRFAKNLKESLPGEAAYDFLEMLRASNEKTPDKYVMRSLFLKDCVFATEPKVRVDAMKRLAACWEIILGNQLDKLRILAIMKPLLDSRPQNQFSEAFFKVYDSLSGAGEAGVAK